MALVLKDRVKVLATTTGTGAFTLGSAVTGYQDFSVIGNGNTTYYTISAQATPDWEVGIGTYTASGTTLSRDTILSSSNGGAAVDFPAGTKDVFVTYPAERAVYEDAAGDYPVQNTFGTLNAANAVLTAGTVSTTPLADTDIANKLYVDNLVASGIHFHAPVRVESPTALTVTYNNGASGVGATLTNAGTQVALVIDGVTVSVNDRVLIYTQTNATQNGVYVVTSVGSGSTNWVLTRSDDTDSFGLTSPNTLGEGSTFFVQQGTTGAGETYTCNTTGTITFGTTNITFAQISSAQIYSAGTGLTLSGTQFSLSNTGTAGTYGSASNVPVFTTNAQGQVTSATNTAIAIAAGAVSGLAASATTDTTNASNITSGTLGTSRLSGSYTGVTGVGTLTAGTWNGSTIGATYGGTGLSSFAAGDIIYADSSTTLARLADTAVGNALISGGAAADPSWGKIGLATHVDGILPVANGGTGNATNQAASVANSATFNNGGAGAASGSTFNGSSPLTISYNTLGAYPTTNPAGYTSNTGTVTSVGGTGTVNGLTLTGTVTTSGNLTLGGTLSGIANAALTNSSVTVNGTSIALGASGTITANNPNALTINNGGAGAASGTTYNGSSAITISYNTVGAPSTTGTGASGNWNINAATVTNGVYTIGDQTIAGNKTFSGVVNGTFESSNARFKFKAADADGGSYALIGLDWGGAVGTYKDFEVYDYVNGRALFRSFGATRNFEVYGSVTGTSFSGAGTGLTGTAASLSIGGSAATATTAAKTSATTVPASTAFSKWLFATTGTGGVTNWNDVTNTIPGVGTTLLLGSASNGPGGATYYHPFNIEFAGNSGTGNVTQMAIAYSSPANELYMRGRYDGTWNSWTRFLNSANFSTYAVKSQTQGNWSGTGVIDNVVGLLAWKNYGNGHVIFDASNSTTPNGTACSNTDSTSAWTGTYPTLMGWNGSTTYGVRVDRARLADTVVNQSEFITKIGASYYQVNTWLQLNGPYGLYCPTINGAHFQPNTINSFGEWATQGSKGGYSGIYLTHSGVNGMMYDSAGNGGVYREANGRWFWYYVVGSDCMGIGTSATDSSYSLYLTKGVRANSTNYTTGATYSSIYYDYNDATYYVDPAVTSVMNSIITRGTLTCTAAGIISGQQGGVQRGYLWNDSSGFGFLNSGGSWALRVNQGTNTIHVESVLSIPSTVGSGTFPMSISSVDRGIVFGSSSGSAISCYFTVSNGATVSGNITASGGSTSYNTSSDYRMKENDLAIDIDAALVKIMSLRPVTFDWKQEFGGRKGIGFIAHELDVVAPECVNGEKDAVKEDGTINPQSVDTSWLIPSICAAMQKQQNVIEQLMAEVATLKGN
jgi:hypothetical protein